MVFAVTSLPPARASAQRLLQLNREHWSIENKVHWVRDVVFDEDRSQVRKKAAHLMATLRNLAMSVLRLAGAATVGIARPPPATASERCALPCASSACSPVTLARDLVIDSVLARGQRPARNPSKTLQFHSQHTRSARQEALRAKRAASPPASTRLVRL